MAKRNIEQDAVDYANELQDILDRNQRRQDLRLSRFSRRVDNAINKVFKDLQKNVLKSIEQLETTEDGIIENTYGNTRQILARKAQFQKIIRRAKKLGDAYFLDEGIKMQELTQEDFKEYDKLAGQYGLDLSYTLIDEESFRQAAKQSQLLYNDFTGKLADEVQMGLMRKVLGGITSEQLVEEYTRIVPAIDKPKRGGGRFRLSAEARSRFTIRTETIRLANQVNHKLNSDAFGENYFIVNYNPMDERTAPACMRATEAGPMTVSQFISLHGLPPRHVNCRCTTAAIPDVFAKRLKK